jgi:hypothetical protein
MIVSILMQTRFASYRRVIGVVLLLGSALMNRVLCDVDILSVVPSLGQTCSGGTKMVADVMGLFGGWSGVVGILGAKPKT